jgi:hypothetical protein
LSHEENGFKGDRFSRKGHEILNENAGIVLTALSVQCTKADTARITFLIRLFSPAILRIAVIPVML